jgi:hypothetical protein
MATDPWSPVSHALHGPSFRKGLMNVFYLQHMVNKQGNLPYLPQELWVYIAGFVSRSWFPEAACSSSSSSPSSSSNTHGHSNNSNNSIALPSPHRRREWRKRRLGLTSDDMDWCTLLEEEDTERPDLHVVEPMPMVIAACADVKSESSMSDTIMETGATASSLVNGLRITWV